MSVATLPTGAQLRLTNPDARAAVVCMNGGQSAEVEGTWSATLEWLVGRLAPRFRSLVFGEVRYRVKSWRQLGRCEADARAAIRATGSPRTLLLGFSMGGAVAVRAVDEPGVSGIVGLAPWLPDRLDLRPLRGKRLAVFHGNLDRWLPGIPGVSPSHSRLGYERAVAEGAEGRYEVLEGALHGVAVRSPWGAPVPLPRAGRWAELVADELERFEEAA
jgi:pimeloyl-ACP methyl ester carboxylesterase